MVLFPEVEEGHKESREVLRIFLWAVWQRSVMLYFYYVLEVQLSQGYSPRWNSMLAIKGIKRLSDLDSDVYREDGIDYMCNWAFEVLRTSRSSICLDFRTMISRFNAHFGDRVGRCMKDTEDTCLGDKPESCQRFTATETSPQSFHASGCSGFCDKIMWSEESYKSLAGPRAVRLDVGAKNLQYCKASPLTMAISHVWSHGQGGRPEHGINLCLHQLYMYLAVLVECESYWIDSTCIPNEHKLRMEAINGINSVFTTSRVVLISDADLQSVDASNEDLNSLETLMSVLLVCDWNVRAWTMLEAIRGRKNVFLLCKSRQVISMMELFRHVLKNGAIDLAVLLGSAQHLLQSSESDKPVAIEDSGSLLSQRHASRPGDEVVIWSLLNNLPGSKSPLDLWRSQKHVRSGYLMSSTPRVHSDGYNWAPSEPYVRPQSRTVSLGNDDHQKMQNYMVCYRPYDGEGSFLANIIDRGLEGIWCIRQVDADVLVTYRNNFCDKTPLGVGYPSEQELNPDLDEEDEVFEQPDTANVCNMIEGFLKNGTIVRMIKPVASCGTKPYGGGSKRGEAYGVVGALCVLIAGSDTWRWKGVYQWLEAPEEFPFWEIDKMVIA
ncbi:hypothetical protein BJ875DRAFT_374529 [Amylocarpus encephaloides]|uniref:Heterokaryon incompatibility domain-containing protein n=1 Tax=Amylocarpus encephaloides TaxID=45428 RepID=A0A9P7YLH1_9HELO|nr:hypothetical protein BJ875DRAFT_374529 [Amylocarpus encephaloides]